MRLSRGHRLLIFALGITAFLIGYGAIAKAWPLSTLTIAPNTGYFTGVFDTQGDDVFPNSGGPAGCTAQGGNSIPDTIDTVPEFVNFITCKLNNGSAREKVGAAFIIQTMIGSSRTKPPTAAQIAEWSDRVSFASSLPSGIIWHNDFSYTVNTYWQGNSGGGSEPNDDAFFADTDHMDAIVFRNSAGKVVYAIRRACANPVGNTDFGALQDRPQPNFNMSGSASVTNGAGTTGSSVTTNPGDTLTFNLSLKNQGTDPSPAISASSLQTVNGGAATTITPFTNTGTYAAGASKAVLAPQTYTVPANTAPGTVICRAVSWQPDTSAGGTGTSTYACATVAYDYTLVPTINVTSNGNPVTGVVEQGDPVTFTYNVLNSGTTTSQTPTCTIYGLTKSGYAAIPAPNDTTSDPGYVQPSETCPAGGFPVGTTGVAVENVTASVANKTICRTLSVSPRSDSDSSAVTIEVCVPVGVKPYMRVYGGDVSAGNGFAPTCTNNSGAAIVGWNKEAASFSGAGTQFAAFALDQIYDFATAQNSSGAAPGSGLAFANTSTSTSKFGDDFGSVPCIPDYYSTLPAGATALPATDISGLATNTYTLATDTTLQGALGTEATGAGRRIIIYVKGNVLINGNITYPASWASGGTPFFELVVKGNIYISKTVTQLDGFYIAQRNGGSGGSIYTCANTGLPMQAVNPTGGAAYDQCGNKLTVNGSFTAYQVQFLRASGTLSKSDVTKNGATDAAAEVFNYSPALWMSSPPNLTVPDTYDSITSLPPIL